jgi:predicted DCC family thiol-disulfide oxidoreductase YuxK
MANTGTDDMTDRLIVFYDGGCPLCSREIAHYRRLNSLSRVDWLDITRQPERLDRYGLAPLDALATFHVMDDSAGRMHTGADAFIRLWRVLPGYRWLAKLINVLHVSPILERVYRAFARRHFQKRCREGACGA